MCSPENEMYDRSQAKEVEVQIRADGKVLWVNTGKGCVLRISRIGSIRINDLRKK